MRLSVLSLLTGVALTCAGCGAKSTTGSTPPPGDKQGGEKTPGKEVRTSGKKANPLVGKWKVTKSNEHWAGNVSKQAVIEFLNDGETMSITNNNGITAEANYSWQGKDFVFQAKFTRPDGSKNGYGAQVIVERKTDDEIVADIFTLKRIK